MNIIFSSCGNDSVALIQWAIENKLPNLVVAYSDTKWAADFWLERVERVKAYVETNNGTFHTIESEGFEELTKRKKGFPANGMAFCSYELKIAPAMAWLDEVDPNKEAACYTGVMRLESEKRKNWPEVVEESPNHGGRRLISPMAAFKIYERDDLLKRAGFEILPHRSAECWPCVNANIKDIQLLREPDVKRIEVLENDLGIGKRSGKPKYMFRSAKCGGAQGIREVKAWADHGGGHYSPDQEDLFGCDSGFCGM